MQGKGMNKLQEIIRLENISRKYDGRTILSSIDAVFYKGQSVAFTGHNGCGKSTLLKLIAKLITPTSGQVLYQEPLLFHYIPDKFPPVPLTAREYLRRMGSISGMERQEIEHSIELLGKDFFIEEMLDTLMTKLSKGSLQKVGVIQAIMKKPDVLLLDEPLSGQDAESQQVFIDKINRFRNEQVTIFTACHEEKLVDAIAESVYRIKDGVMMNRETMSQADD